MYNNITTKIRTGNQMGVEVKILRGVKQGDPLSPLLFNLCMEPLIEAIEEQTSGVNINNNRKIPILAFADDIALLWGAGDTKARAHHQIWYPKRCNQPQEVYRSSGLELDQREQ
jgi:hypothetical protein